MKKVLSVLMVAVALMMAAPAQAQLIKFGVKGGMDFTELDTNVKAFNEVAESSTGFFIGPMAEVTLPIIGLGVDGAVMFAQRGKDELKQQGLEIPVNLKYTIGLGSVLGIYLAVGPDFFFNFNDTSHEYMKMEEAQVSINLGAGLKLLKKLQVGLTYQIPIQDSHYLTNISLAPDAKASDVGAAQKTWQVSLAYIF